MNKRFMIVLFLVVIISTFYVGCTSESSNGNKIAYISSNTPSGYEKTFKELNLGILFDYNLKLPKADKSWVTLWVEGYSEGEAVQPFHLAELSYGLSPNEMEEGRTGFGMINPDSDNPQLFLYSLGASLQSRGIENNFIENHSVSTWAYAIGNETIGLDPGEEKVLAVYRRGKNSMRSGYDYQDKESINEMINEDTAVLLLKIKVEEKSEI